MAKKPEKIDTSTLPQDGIGVLNDGQLDIVNADDPPFKPRVFDKDGYEIDPDTIEPDAPADE